MEKSKFSSIKKRTISALVAVTILYFIYQWLDVFGLVLLACLSQIIIAREANRLLNPNLESRTLRFSFYIFGFLTFLAAGIFPEFAIYVLAISSIVYAIVSLFLRDKFSGLDDLLGVQIRSIFAFFYAGLLPAFSVQILLGNQGLHWFLTLLGIVFCGDIFAYFFGILFGRRKLMPTVSPNKTVEGALGGLLGSCAIAITAGVYFFPKVPWYLMLVMGLIAGISAQFGDLFESALKRVSNVKDSGAIMPGHGGLLDRLDGVLFATPIVLVFSLIIDRFF